MTDRSPRILRHCAILPFYVRLNPYQHFLMPDPSVERKAGKGDCFEFRGVVSVIGNIKLSLLLENAESTWR
jgi:hypothetical protein